MRRPKLPTAAIQLAAVLAEGGTEAEAIRARVHRTMLWRYTTGRRLPDADTIAVLHELSSGRVAASGWSVLTKRRTGTDG